MPPTIVSPRLEREIALVPITTVAGLRLVTLSFITVNVPTAFALCPNTTDS